MAPKEIPFDLITSGGFLSCHERPVIHIFAKSDSFCFAVSRVCVCKGVHACVCSLETAKLIDFSPQQCAPDAHYP